MNIQLDKETGWLVGGVLALLVVATVIGQVLRLRVRSEQGAKTVQNLNARPRPGGSWLPCSRWRC